MKNITRLLAGAVRPERRCRSPAAGPVATIPCSVSTSWPGQAWATPRQLRQVRYWALTSASRRLRACCSPPGVHWRSRARTYQEARRCAPDAAVLPAAALRRGSSACRIAAGAGRRPVFAICCIVAAYAVIGPARGSTLAILLVVMVFCAFTLTPRPGAR